MKQLIVCREYPPAPYPPGGIGTYTRHLARLLADAGHTVHVVAQRWEGAPARVEELLGGRLIIHRVAPGDSGEGPSTGRKLLISRALLSSDCPSQAFAWEVAAAAERVARAEAVELIEAPEWEASLYYLQLRRMLGLSPGGAPCLIHLHSPSELIFRHNQWDPALSDYEPLRRMERFSVKFADAVVCPSEYLAREAERLFDLEEGRVEVIPYPMGDTPRIDRGPEVWERNSFCYAGRLELRKGIIEWVDAAVSMAESHSEVTFDFAGSDTSLDGGPAGSVRRLLERRIPQRLRRQFRFHGSLGREELARILRNSSAAVVPSRWENLPYTCIEAMSAGLPVLASPCGGMRELIADGESGWIAEEGSAAALARSLGRAIATSGSEKAKMGARAEEAVRRHCSNRRVLELHSEFRRRIAERRGGGTVNLPAGSRAGSQTGAIARESRGQEDAEVARGVHTSRAARRGMAVVVTGGDTGLLTQCLAAIERQTRAAAAVLIAANPNDRAGGLGPDRRFIGPLPAPIWQNAVPRVKEAAALACGVLFVDEALELEPGCLAACECAFDEAPRLGFLSGMVWNRGHGELHASGCPDDEWLTRDLPNTPLAAVRMETLERVAKPAGGEWVGVTYPGILASSTSLPGRRPPARRYSVMALAQKTSPLVTVHWFLAVPWREKLRWLTQLTVQPQRSLRWLVWQFRAGTRRAD